MTDETLLYRQVHPSFIQNGEPSSQTFRPAKKDKINETTYHLSVYNGEKFSPQNSFEHYTKAQSSSGVLGVTSGECYAASTTVHEDNDPFDGHCAIVFQNLSNNKIEVVAKKLKDAALKRGWQYRPT